MGLNNKQRRAAKARQRAQRRATDRTHEDDTGPVGPDPFQAGSVHLALRELLAHAARGHLAQQDLARFARFGDGEQQSAIDRELSAAVTALIGNGWTPLDLREIARRKLTAPLTGHLLGGLAAHAARFGRTQVHPAWAAQLDGVAPGADSRVWARRHRLPWPAARTELIGLLVRLGTLPRLRPVLPAPGTVSAESTAAGVDERVLAKVRALLAKAESTEYEHEAEALTAKAQQLMARYSIERSLAEADAPRGAEPAVRRVWIDAPYVDAKSLLVDEVAQSNRSRCLLTKGWDYVTLVGFESDLDTVELLTTSLLVQATRAMTLSGSHTARDGTSRTRSFRRAFLLAYGQRIGERLRAAVGDAETHADADHDGRLLPVLAARDAAVDETMARLFPDMESHLVRITNAAGWGAGRAAADLARFDIRDTLDGRRAG